MAALRRVLGFVVVAGAAVGLFLLAGGASDEAGKRYWIELDNAFGLVEGADTKIGGVRAGKVKKLKLDRTDMRALVQVELTTGGFDDVRADVRCETRPQSLIGEYFIDCRPGTSPKRLPDGATIPVEQTETTVPLDLINDIMRRPYRERWTILLSELGAGLAARGPDLNATIRRAVPALRQVDRLLAILREQRTTIRDLYRDADRIMVRVADRREHVGRFIEEARDTSSVGAPEAARIRDQWRTFPTFLRELRPTLDQLHTTAGEQIPALQNLNRAAPHLEELFETLGPYADASRPATRSLASAAEAGRPAVRAARAPVRELRRGVDDLPEASRNLAITLKHIDDPRFATEKDARAGRGPDGGYTGLEALLRYFFAQSQAINLFDAASYTLKASVFLDRACANYADADDVRDGTSPPRCRAWMGPNQPGVTSGDPTRTGGEARAARNDRDRDGGDDRERTARDRDARDGGRGDGGSGDNGDGDKRGDGPGSSLVPKLDDLLPRVPDLPQAPQLPQPPSVPPAPEPPRVDTKGAEGVLDFLLGQ